MDVQVAQTRIVRPRFRPDSVVRPRLLHLLEPISTRRLFLVIASAGYGKTTLLVDWARQAQMRVCWYQLAPTDQDSHQFYLHFIAALQSQIPSFGRDSLSALNGLVYGQGSVEQLLITVVNDLYANAQEDFALVIDDYHLVDREEEIAYFVSQFAQYAPDTCHIVLASRTLISLPDLDLLVARGDVSGIGHEDLAFRPDEIQVLAEQQFRRHLDLSQAQVLAEFSEGWVTGLLLSGTVGGWHNSAQMRVLRASGVDLYSYFAQQVLDRQLPEVRDFLLRTSLMEDLDPDLCVQIFQSKVSAEGLQWSELLHRVRRNNLFVSEPEAQHRRLRYHSLFQEFLQKLFFRERPEEAGTILHRLVTIYAERQQWEQAYQNLRLVGDVPVQLEFLDSHGIGMLNSGRNQLLVRWVEELPESAKFAHGNLLTAYGRALVLTGESKRGIQILGRAELVLRQRNDPVTLSRMLAFRSAAWRLVGHYQDSLRDAEQAIELTASEECGTELQATIATCLRSKGLALYMMGQVEPGMSWLQKALVAYQALEDAQEIPIVLMDVGLVHLNAGSYAQALSLFEQALLELRRQHNVAGQANVLNNLGYLYYLRGEYQTALVALEEALFCAQKSGYKRIEAFVLATVADMLDELGLTEAAGGIYDLCASVAEQVNERYLILHVQLARARVAWALGNWEAAYRYLEDVEHVVREKDSLSEWSLYRLTIGRYYLARNKPDSALSPLNDAAEYYVSSGQIVDTARVQIFLAAATAHKDPEAAQRIVEQAVKSAQRGENGHFLIATGAQARAELEPLVATVNDSAVAQFLTDIREFALSLPALRRIAVERLSDWLPMPPAPSPALMVRAFGKPEVLVRNRLVSNSDWATLAARDLFFCLVAHPEGMTKEEVGVLFWPDCSIDQLKTRFKNTIHRMRNALPEDTIVFADDFYRFNRQSDYEYDVELFLARVEEAKATNDPAAKTRALAAAFELYRGPFLPTQDAFWAISKREILHQVFIEVGLDLCSLYLNADRTGDALNCCLRILAEDPCLEEAHRLAMRIHAASGNRAAIASQFEQCRHAIETEIDAEPSPQTVDLYETLMQRT